MPAWDGGTSTRMTWRSIVCNSATAVSCSSFIGIGNDRICGWFPPFPDLNDPTVVMNRDSRQNRREDALSRAECHAPFLRDAMKVHPEIAGSFLAEGAGAAASQALSLKGDDLESELRRRRRAL